MMNAKDRRFWKVLEPLIVEHFKRKRAAEEQSEAEEQDGGRIFLQLWSDLKDRSPERLGPQGTESGRVRAARHPLESALECRASDLR